MKLSEVEETHCREAAPSESFVRRVEQLSNNSNILPCQAENVHLDLAHQFDCLIVKCLPRLPKLTTLKLAVHMESHILQAIPSLCELMKTGQLVQLELWMTGWYAMLAQGKKKRKEPGGSLSAPQADFFEYLAHNKTIKDVAIYDPMFEQVDIIRLRLCEVLQCNATLLDVGYNATLQGYPNLTTECAAPTEQTESIAIFLIMNICGRKECRDPNLKKSDLVRLLHSINYHPCVDNEITDRSQLSENLILPDKTVKNAEEFLCTSIQYTFLHESVCIWSGEKKYASRRQRS